MLFNLNRMTGLRPRAIECFYINLKEKVFKLTFRRRKMEVKEDQETNAKVSGKPTWVKIKPAELEKLVVEMAKEGKSPAQIGLILRDKHGVPKSKLFGKKITQILREKNVGYQTDANIFEAKIEKLKTHLGKNKKDYSATNSLAKKLWVVRNLNRA